MAALLAILVFSIVLGLLRQRLGRQEQVLLVAGVALIAWLQYAVLGLS